MEPGGDEGPHRYNRRYLVVTVQVSPDSVVRSAQPWLTSGEGLGGYVSVGNVT